jgi:hypothetical protein
MTVLVLCMDRASVVMAESGVVVRNRCTKSGARQIMEEVTLLGGTCWLIMCCHNT